MEMTQQGQALSMHSQLAAGMLAASTSLRPVLLRHVWQLQMGTALRTAHNSIVTPTWLYLHLHSCTHLH
jgi:hypothetical protein